MKFDSLAQCVAMSVNSWDTIHSSLVNAMAKSIDLWKEAFESKKNWNKLTGFMSRLIFYYSFFLLLIVCVGVIHFF